MRKNTYDIPIQQLRSELAYDPDTGDVRWICRRGGVQCGKIVRTRSRKHYVVGLYYGLYPLHRVCWALHYGEWPPQHLEIDHENLNGFDNRLSNLRLATTMQNSHNTAKSWRSDRTATSTFKGVHWHTKRAKWVAKITINKKVTHLGYFDSEIAAREAYSRAVFETRGEYARI